MVVISFNDHILIEIFSWLPPKSLIKFKLLSKHWFSLLSSDYFQQKHILNEGHRSKTEPCSLLLRLLEKPDYFYLHLDGSLEKSSLVPYRFSPFLAEPIVSSFANGLFLLHCAEIKNGHVQECFVFNPTTKQSRSISLRADEDDYKPVIGLNIAFDPLINSAHYKIICVRLVRWAPFSSMGSLWRLCRVEVYESDDCSWKIPGKPFWAPTDMDFNRGVYVNGRIHWHEMFFHIDGGFVGKHPEIEVPGGIGKQFFNREYVESCGYLHCVAHFLCKNKVMVFELARDFTKWSLKCSFELGGVSGKLSVLGVVNGVLVYHEPGKVVACGFRGEVKKVLVDFRDEEIYEEGRIQFVSNDAVEFVESLARV
ncbi:Unknown protein [Striga hermonthica]|uniref:F-box domain-containing protein n=1 Tax=Striga hermonthica TaxID=68872 RepID=A0A9N7MU66_STRHE|nr:Unknown protein [Striga hermonthica]